MKIALIGTRGVPARYGGFETAVEEVGRRLVERGHEVTVFCRHDDLRPSEYLGMRLVHLPAVRQKVAETLSHTALSVVSKHARNADVAIVFNCANAPLVPALKAARVPCALHVDGLEWMRSKWGGLGQRYYMGCEGLAVRWADALIADARGIQDYYKQRYNADSAFIPYGAPLLENPEYERIEALDLTRRNFHLVVARFEPENHVHVAISGYIASSAQSPLVVVGAAPYAHRYTQDLKQLASGDPRVRLIGSIWDQTLLDALYASCRTYIHGHSVGGTNPSLLRAMGAGAPVLAFDVNFNREVLGVRGAYWSDTAGLSQLLQDAEAAPEQTERLGDDGRNRAAAAYTWPDVTDKYEQLCMSLANGPRRSAR